jgi:hypothetical protein
VTVGVALAAVLSVPATASSPGPGNLQNRIDNAGADARSLQGAIGADSRQIASFQGRIDDLEQRLSGLESSLAIERRLLEAAQAELRAARGHLLDLKLRFARDRKTLAQQLVGEYEADRPDLVTVVLNAHGYADLLESMRNMRSVEHHNSTTTAQVRAAKRAVAVEAARLAKLEARRRQITGATYVQTREVASLRSTLVTRQTQFVRARATKSNELAAVRSSRQALERKLSAIQARAASVATSAVPTSSFTGGGGGAYGFFPAAGTNYSVGSEPALAARLDQLGKALKLHLIGVSGYRSPQHSVEVGGFANDPHTKGLASDTPGVEGVSEATLNRFGLTRPFPGAAEADHIQLA